MNSHLTKLVEMSQSVKYLNAMIQPTGVKVLKVPAEWSISLVQERKKKRSTLPIIV
jgi:hypothetical protein